MDSITSTFSRCRFSGFIVNGARPHSRLQIPNLYRPVFRGVYRGSLMALRNGNEENVSTQQLKKKKISRFSGENVHEIRTRYYQKKAGKRAQASFSLSQEYLGVVLMRRLCIVQVGCPIIRPDSMHSRTQGAFRTGARSELGTAPDYRSVGVIS
jgi:hypothetical protein